MRASRRAVLGGFAAAAFASEAMARSRAFRWPAGVQAWSVLDQLRANFDDTLRRLSAIGFVRLESAGWLDRMPEAFGRGVAAAGLRCDSAHIAMPDLARDMRGSVSAVRDAGCELLVCSSPQPPVPLDPALDWMHGLERAMTADAWKRNAALLNEAATIAQAAGLRLAYHNHAAEFVRLGSVTGYDLLLSEADPRLVLLELDIAWAAAGGEDPVALLHRLGRRVVRLHLKDLVRRPARGTMADDFATVPVGQGVLPWRPILAAARRAGVGGAYLELEPPHRRPAFEQLAEGLAYLKAL